jgi:hypothetical protein
MKLKVFGWLVVGCLLYVCPTAMGQSQTFTVIGSSISDNTLGGIKAGGAPWSGTGTCTLSDSGAVKCKIKGLIITGSGSASPVDAVGASLVCNGAVVGTTASAPLSTAGAAKIKGTITLPSRCSAPAILIVVLGASGSTVPPGAGPFIGLSGFTTAGAQDARPIDLPPDQ